MPKNTTVVIALDGARGKTLDVRGDLGLLLELLAALGKRQDDLRLLAEQPTPAAPTNGRPEPAHATA